MKPWSELAGRPVISVTNQLAIETKKTPIVQRNAQIKCGIARISRKKTVRRVRLRSSSTTSWTGCSSTNRRLCSLPDGDRQGDRNPDRPARPEGGRGGNTAHAGRRD